MLNRVVLVGRLTKDPELRYTPSGVAVANFTLAVNRPFKNKDTNENEADFIQCVVWRKAAENTANYLKKGSLCGVDGRLQSRSYEGQDGKMVYITEVVAESVQFLEPKNSNQQNYQNNANTANYGQGNTNTPNQAQSPQNSHQNNNQSPFQSDGAPIDIDQDDLPF